MQEKPSGVSRDANVGFRAAMTELKSEGKGNVALPTLNTILSYQSLIFKQSTILRFWNRKLHHDYKKNKVQFDIIGFTLHDMFVAENMHPVKQSTFVAFKNYEKCKKPHIKIFSGFKVMGF